MTLRHRLVISALAVFLAAAWFVALVLALAAHAGSVR
jgi:hypothetical protein